MKNTNLERLRTIEPVLGSRIVGQPEAVRIVCARLRHGMLGLASAGRPRASFLFLGPTGVGKTELALQFTHEVFGPGKCLIIDMSEFQTKASVKRLIERIRVGYDRQEGEGTLLLDEIEKAHPDVLDLLLQLLDAARLTDLTHRVMDFSRWYVVMSSNLGAQKIMTMRKSIYETMRRLVEREAENHLRPEIFARISEVVVFGRLEYDPLKVIAGQLLANELAQQRARGMGVEVDASAVEVVMKVGYHERLGARPMRNAAETLVRNALVTTLLTTGEVGGTLSAAADGVSLHAQSSDAVPAST